jgi:hypothetical protein
MVLDRTVGISDIPCKKKDNIRRYSIGTTKYVLPQKVRNLVRSGSCAGYGSKRVGSEKKRSIIATLLNRDLKCLVENSLYKNFPGKTVQGVS